MSAQWNREVLDQLGRMNASATNALASIEEIKAKTTELLLKQESTDKKVEKAMGSIEEINKASDGIRAELKSTRTLQAILAMSQVIALLLLLFFLAWLLQKQDLPQTVIYDHRGATIVEGAVSEAQLSQQCFTADREFARGIVDECCKDKDPDCETRRKCEWGAENFNAKNGDALSSMLGNAKFGYVIGGHDDAPIRPEAIAARDLDSNFELAQRRANAVASALNGSSVPLIPVAMSHPPAFCGKEEKDRRRPRIVLLLPSNKNTESTSP